MVTNTYYFKLVNLRDWLHHIEHQEKNWKEGVTYEETLTSDEDEGEFRLVLIQEC